MSELKLCPFCSCTEKADRVYSFGADLPGGNGNIALCLRHTSSGYTLHAESIEHGEDGTDYCDNDDDVPINFCPVCGKRLICLAQPANEPLTPEELRGMDGEPVWTVGVSHTDDGSWSMWDIIEDVGDEGITFGYSTEHCDWWNYNLRGADGKLCGCAWLAYRRPPERSENG